MFKSIQLGISVIAIGAIALLSWGVLHLHDANVKLKTDLTVKETELSNAQENIKTQATAAAFSEWSRGQYLNNMQVIKDENTKLRRDLADGSKRLQPSASCVSAIASPGDTSGTQTPVCRFTARAEEGWLNLNEGIPSNAEQYAIAMRTLNYWHDNWESLCGK